MNKKMIRNLIILGAVVAVAIVAALVLPNIKPPEPQATPAPETVDPALLTLRSYTTDQVSEVTVHNESGTYTVTRKDDTYVLKDRPADKLDQSLARDLFYNAGRMVGDEYIGTTAELNAEEFGLANASVSIDVQYADGTSATFYLGKKTPSGNSYYVMMQGDERIVTVWMNYGTSFMRPADALYWQQSIDLLDTDVQYVLVHKRGEEPLIVQKVDQQRNISIYSWMLTSPWERMCDVEQVSALITQIIALKPGEIVQANVQNLAQYGLDDPAYRFIVATSVQEDQGQRYELLIGDDIDDTYAYAKFTNSDIVCKISKSAYAFTNTYTPFALSDKFLALVNIEHVTKLALISATESGDLLIEHERELDAEGNPKNDANGNPSYKQIFSIVGVADLDQKQSVTWYQHCIGLKAHSELEAGFTTNAAPAVTLTYERSREPAQVLVEFLPYDKDFYAVRIDGQLLFRTRIDTVHNMIENFKLLKKGELPVN